MKKILLVFFVIFSIKTNCQNLVNERAKWFVNDRFGMFIHWGLYSGAEGNWKGEKVRYDNDYAEWIQYRNQIEKSEYIKLSKRFDWNKIDPEEWVLLAKKAGMKYITITAKHHDGFAIWNSKASDFNIYNYSKPKRDIIKDLSEACKKHNMKLGFYYSHWTDWEHPYAWDNSKEIYWLDKDKFDIYWQEKVIPQMKELLTNYGEISMIWFDMWLHHDQTIVSKDQLLQLKNLIREIQPNCLINSRLGLSVEEDADVDFRTLGDNQLGEYKFDYPWQTPATVAHSWGYSKNENEWKSTTSILRSLIGNVSLNGNLMLNIGPTSDGSVPYEIRKRFSEIGEWLKFYGKSVYGAEAFDLRSNLHDWGLITYKPYKQRKYNVFLNIFDQKPGNNINVTGIQLSANIGSVTAALNTPVDVSGSQLTMSLGEETPTGTATVQVSGSQANFTIGTFSVSADGNVSVVVTEHDLTITAGAIPTVTGDATVSVSGIQATLGLGEETVDLNTPVDVTGISAATSIGSATAVPGVDVAVTGVQITGSINGPLITAWSNVDPNVTNTWTEVSKGVSNTWTEVDIAA